MERSTLERFQRLEQQLADKYGPFTLFGLFYFADNLWHWDLVVSAPWLLRNRQQAYQTLADALVNGAGGNLADLIGGPRLLDENHPLLEMLLKGFNLEHGLQQIDGIDLPLHEVRRAYVITCRPATAEAVV
jgi:hypothetical protein